MKLRFHSEMSSNSSVSIYASSWGTKEAERVLELLALLKRWLQQDQYDERYAQFRRNEWIGMSAG